MRMMLVFYSSQPHQIPPHYYNPRYRSRSNNAGYSNKKKGRQHANTFTDPVCNYPMHHFQVTEPTTSPSSAQAYSTVRVQLNTAEYIPYLKSQVFLPYPCFHPFIHPLLPLFFPSSDPLGDRRSKSIRSEH